MTYPVEFTKLHALGNDYLVMVRGPRVTAALAVALCDRHGGLGADGVLEPLPSANGVYCVRIWNPDGSVAQKSGNGLRIYARWLLQYRAAPHEFEIATDRCVVACRIAGQRIAVHMGKPSFVPADVPVASPEPLIEAPLHVAGELLRVTAVASATPTLWYSSDLR